MKNRKQCFIILIIIIVLMVFIGSRINKKCVRIEKIEQTVSNDNIGFYIPNSDGTSFDKISSLSDLTSGYYINAEKSYCTTNGSSDIKDKDTSVTLKYENGKVFVNTEKKDTKCWIYFNFQPTSEFNYNGNIQTFIASSDGQYQLEVWGASGGSANDTRIGGYGGYSKGVVELKKGDTLYVVVGGVGTCKAGAPSEGGYNGGGGAYSRGTNYSMCSGGGATHIAKVSGLLSTLSGSQSSVLIVAGGGGGAGLYNTAGASGGSGGGIVGASTTGNPVSTGGSQTAGGSGRAGTGTFGQGAGSTTSYSCGGGGGYYGGGSDQYEWAGAGGSGYIGNASLNEKAMYCYGCATSTVTGTLTYNVSNVSETPISNYAKIGDGYAKITYID